METVKEKLMKIIQNGGGFKCGDDAGTFADIPCDGCRYEAAEDCVAERIADALIQNGVTIIPKSGIGDMSDGYHTFNELYHHRALLFATICNMHPEKAWKSKKHDDGSMYDGMFIVGIETVSGQATYHYDIEPYWDMFHVRELEKAPVWDGHTPEEALQRITTLQDAKPLNEFLAPIDEYQGLKQKYLVFKADSGERVMDCFVLRPQKDLAAAEALRAYANATDNKVLADDIRNWIGEGEVLQDETDTNVGDKWVSVDERLPITEKEALKYYEVNSEFPQFIVKIDVGVTATVLEFNGKDWFDGYATYNVTHWMPLPAVPQPPKEDNSNE